MRQAIMIRVVPEDFDLWKKTHDEHREARLAYGMTDGPVYAEAGNPRVALVQLDVENLERAMEWFKSETFKAAVKAAGNVRREIWIAQQPTATRPNGDGEAA